jgi:hypothetical protein
LDIARKQAHWIKYKTWFYKKEKKKEKKKITIVIEHSIGKEHNAQEH